MASAWKIGFFLITIGFFDLATSQNQSAACYEPLKKYAICVERATDLVVRDVLPIVQKIENCFNNSNCTKSDGQNFTSDRSEPTGLFKNVPLPKLWECAENASQVCFANTSSCIIERVPEWNNTARRQEQAATLIQLPMNYIQDKLNKLESLCPNAAGQEKAKQCVDVLVKDFKPPTMDIIQKASGAMCAAKNHCRSDLNPTCQQRLEQVKQASCSCFQQQALLASDHFFNCINMPVLNALRRLLDVGPYFKNSQTSEFCNLFDPCHLAAAAASTTSNGQSSNLMTNIVDAGKNLLTQFGGQ